MWRHRQPISIFFIALPKTPNIDKQAVLHKGSIHPKPIPPDLNTKAYIE